MKIVDYRVVSDFLSGVNISQEIENFPSKVSRNGFLRDACISHIKRLYGISVIEATKSLDWWLEHCNY